ncbi:hypothetical protein EOPP23_19430 [Endozoicomonas sp. OPT23]|uniref:ricin-type beta-trefoil lectin domain protein n=1 Tax=Endozoicomonas sp. OPT23 TaxID=2072845 RepID=UPI00129ABEC7|nr:ricin-type beta-trefoil lectin domain protein [Endozoicomonas sp. OPT23]MRI35142.1 hypothetical protein [Endozoicomonas sp. OPT23]
MHPPLSMVLKDKDAVQNQPLRIKIMNRRWLKAAMASAILCSGYATADVQGPGLGNLTYSSSELFKPISWIDRNNGIPATYPSRKAFGANVGIMLNGYFMTMFAPDSGKGPGGWLVYDVSDPRNISLRKTVYEPTGRTREFREPHAFGVSEINGKSYVAVQTIKGVEFWDFTDVDNIQQVSKLVLPGVNGGDYSSVSWQLWWQAPYLYVSNANQGMYIVDASDPEQPYIANRGNNRPNPVPPGELGGFRVGPVFSIGNQLVLTSMDNTSGWASLDISDPLNPVLLDTVSSHNKYYATCFDGTKVHASTRGSNAKMVTYDLSDPNEFVLDNNSLRVDHMLYCGTQDDYVFQGAEDFMHKIDISNINNYVELGKGFLPRSNTDHGQVAPMGNLIYIGNDHGTGNAFMVHDVNPDTTPPAIKQVSPRDGAANQAITSRIGIAFSDTVLYESLNTNSIQLLDDDSNQVSGTFSAQLGIVNFSPAAPLKANSEYTIKIVQGGVSDYVGNTVAAEFTSTFTTASSSTVPVQHWPLDTDTQNVVSGNHGTLIGGQLQAAGGVAQDANGEWISLEQDISTLLGSSSSLAFSMSTTQAGSNNAWLAPGIAGRDHAGGTNDVFWGWIDGSGKLKLSAGNDTGITSPEAVNDGALHHYVLTRDSSTGSLVMYQDGQQLVSGSAKSGVLGGQTYNSYRKLGTIDQNPTNFQGFLDDVRIYNKVLNATQVSELYQQLNAGVTQETRESTQETGTASEFTAVTQGDSSTTYKWNFGDGISTQPSTNPIATHTYTQAGHYEVILTVTTGSVSRNYNFVRTVSNPLTTNTPTASSKITGSGSLVFNVNPDNNTVTAIHRLGMNKVWETSVGNHPATVAVDNTGLIWIAVKEDDKLVALNSSGSKVREVQLNYGDGPYGVAFIPGTGTGLVTLQSSGEVLSFDAATGNILQRRAVNAEPRGIAISGDGANAWITRLRSTDQGLITQINTSDLSTVKNIPLQVDSSTVDAEDRARGIPNYLTHIAVSPDGLKAFVPSKKDNILRGTWRDGEALTHDSAVRAILSQIDLNQGQELSDRQFDFNDRDAPHAVAFTPLGDYVFVAMQGSNSVEIVDAYSGAHMGAIDNTGLAPQGVWVDGETKRAFIYNFTTRSVSIYDIDDVISSLSFSPNRLANVTTVGFERFNSEKLLGLQIFYNARDPRMSRDGYLSCASCHLEGDDDGTVWDFTDRGEGLRNTITLKGRKGMGHGNVHWTANFDEIQDFENDIRNGFGGTGFLTDADFNNTSNPLGNPKAGLSSDLDALATYVASLDEFDRSPSKTSSGELTIEATTGEQLFSDVGCATCHSGPSFTDGQRHDVGTIKPSSGQGISQPLQGVGFDTPTLLGVWRTAPYFHDGQAATLADVISSGHGANRTLSVVEQNALVVYVGSLDGVTQQSHLKIKQVHEDKCWSVNAVAGAEIQRLTCSDAASQQWSEDTQSRFHPLANEALCATAQAANNSNFTLEACSDSVNQQWQTDGNIILSSANSNFAIDAYAGQPSKIGIWQYHGNNNQQWQKQTVNTGVTFNQYRNARYGCLSATGLNQDSNVVVNNCDSSDSQQWSHYADGSIHLKADTGFCLDYKGEANNNGQVVLASCNSSDNQKFDFDNGLLKTRKNDNYVVDAFGSTNGSNVGIWTQNDGDNQQWIIE